MYAAPLQALRGVHAGQRYSVNGRGELVFTAVFEFCAELRQSNGQLRVALHIRGQLHERIERFPFFSQRTRCRGRLGLPSDAGEHLGDCRIEPLRAPCGSRRAQKDHGFFDFPASKEALSPAQHVADTAGFEGFLYSSALPVGAKQHGDVRCPHALRYLRLNPLGCRSGFRSVVSVFRGGGRLTAFAHRLQLQGAAAGVREDLVGGLDNGCA